MYSQHANQRKTLLKVVIFCISGMVIIPLILRDCAEFPSSSRSTSTFPTEAQLIGTYVPDIETVKYISDVQDRLGIRQSIDVQIRIQMGGFEMRDIPCVTKRHGPRFLISFSRNTSWNTYKEGDTWRMYFDSEYKEGIRADVLGEKPPYRIRLMVGDPSINEPLTFVKAQL